MEKQQFRKELKKFYNKNLVDEAQAEEIQDNIVDKAQETGLKIVDVDNLTQYSQSGSKRDAVIVPSALGKTRKYSSSKYGNIIIDDSLKEQDEIIPELKQAIVNPEGIIFAGAADEEDEESPDLDEELDSLEADVKSKVDTESEVNTENKVDTESKDASNKSINFIQSDEKTKVVLNGEYGSFVGMFDHVAICQETDRIALVYSLDSPVLIPRKDSSLELVTDSGQHFDVEFRGDSYVLFEHNVGIMSFVIV